MKVPSRLISLVYTACLLPSVLAGGIQYCRNEPPLCFAVATTTNKTAGGHDIHVSLSATPSKNGGWVGVGIGKKMAGSLFFLVYSDEARKSAVASIRTVESHDNPTLLKDHETHVEVLDSSISAMKYHAHFVCYSCDQWWPTRIWTESKTSFIYAANRDQAFDKAEPDSVLMFHDAYGIVEGDMDAALLASPDEPIPPISPGETSGFELLNENGATKTPTGSPLPSSWPSPGTIHGVVMSVTFMGLFTLGGIFIQLPLARAFKYHWVIQMCALLLALSSATYMVTRSAHFDLHKILGLTVVSALAVQAAVGYKHHTVFVRIQRQSVFTSVHRWLGRGLLLLGTVNVALGLYHRGRPTGSIITWFVIWLAEIAAYVWVLRRKQRQKKQQHRAQPVPKDEHEAGLFGLGGDESGDSEESEFEEEV